MSPATFRVQSVDRHEDVRILASGEDDSELEDVPTRGELLAIADNGTTGLYILWETDELISDRPTNYLGAPLPVVFVHPHGDADLVTLTARLPAQAPERLRVSSLAFRMPEVGEPLAVFGYRHMSLIGEVRRGDPATIDYERILTVGVGQVLEQQPERRSTALRGCPGVATDAPIHSGMSGGPVYDKNGDIVGFASSSLEPSHAGEPWNSYVALCTRPRARLYDAA